MAKEKSQSTLISLNIFATITAIIFAVLSQTDDDFDFLKKWYIIALVIILYLIINRRRVLLFLNRVTSQIRFFLNIIVEYRMGHLEFLDPYGRKAMYHEECLMRKIKKKKLYEASITATGKIQNNIHTYNCYCSLNPKKDKINIVYGKKGNPKDKIINSRQLQFGFAVTFIDTFTSKKESWETRFNHPTKHYDLRISFRKKNPPKNADIFLVTTDGNGNEKLKTLPIDPLIIQKYNRVVLKIKLLHIQKGDRIRVVWEWNNKKKTKSSKKEDSDNS